MALWTDVIDPTTLTGYARASLADYEARQGSLAQLLPNRDVADVVVRFMKGESGLVDVAPFRAYDAEPELGARPAAERVTLELPALSLNIPISEYEQLRMRSGQVDNEAALATIQTTTDRVVRAVSDQIERLRGIVLATGRATIDQPNFKMDDDFGRSEAHTVVADEMWNDRSVSRLEYLSLLVEQYVDTNGEPPGSMFMSSRVFREMAAGQEFQTQLLNGGSRAATAQQARDIVTGSDLPPVYTYDRRVSVNGQRVRALPDNLVLFAPEPVDINNWQSTQLGATWWGRTMTSTEASWAVPQAEQPGIVAGAWANDKPPHTREVIADAIALPVMANADLTLSARVLS